MVTLTRLYILLALQLLFSCNKTESTTPQATAPAKAASVDNNKQQIEKLVKNMYRWQESGNYYNGFEPIKKDTLVVGLSQISYSRFLKNLDDSGFFASEFTNNMTAIMKTQDSLYRNGKVVWDGVDMGPFDPDASPWCDCQDYPTDAADPFGKITITFQKVDDVKAELTWNWAKFNYTTPYKMRTVKENGQWKIAYMQGWDYEYNIAH